MQSGVTSALACIAAAVLSALLWRQRSRQKRRLRVVGIIPARYQSVRFPGKPLVDILGKPMIVRTFEQASQATTLNALYVATDDQRIAEACLKAGAKVIMTSSDCPNGTERCNEAVQKLAAEYDVVINIQGDEPLMEPEVIDDIVRALQSTPDAVYSTACTPLSREEVPMRNRVKCIIDKLGYAIYFSRGVLPANKDGMAKAFPAPFEDTPYLLHLGVQCYDRRFLADYCRMPATPLMLMEDLEQLKVLENGYKIKVIIVNHRAHGVDEPEDVASVEEKMRVLGLS